MRTKSCCRPEDNDRMGHTWISYGLRLNWSDVKPIWESKDYLSAFAIKYSERFRELNAYLRAVLKSGEKSSRVLELTSDAIYLNPANYTAWYLRRKVLQGLHKIDEGQQESGLPRKLIDNEMIYGEIQFSATKILSNPKNYQVWHHRRRLFEWLHYIPLDEEKFLNVAFDAEPKNYHAWQYRHWLCRMTTTTNWVGEHAFTDRMIHFDVRNNSAWNHRFFVLEQQYQEASDSKNDERNNLVSRELRFALASIRQCSNNESAYNYLRGILERFDSNHVDLEMVNNYFEQMNVDERLSLEMKLFLSRDRYLRESKKGNDCYEQLVRDIDGFISKLIEIDPIRTNYWMYVADSMKKTDRPRGGQEHS
ncbi:hypothetical protein ACOME3_009598 [Neoechinorhynchus agilis]